MTAIEQAKEYALQKTGLNWERRDRWDDADRTAYLAANAEFRRDNPLIFTADELAAGVNMASTAATPAPEFSYVAEFAKEAGAQVERINPFSGQNYPGFVRSLSRIAALSAVVATLYLLIKYTPARAEK